MAYFTLDDVRDGDVIGFSGKGWVSAVINAATYGLPYWSIAHVGIVSTVDGVKYLFESTTFNGGEPCAIRRKVVAGSQARKLSTIMSRPGKIWWYPLVGGVDEDQEVVLSEMLVRTLGRGYDYLGAFRSSGAVLRLLRSEILKEDTTTVFCSELVAHALESIGVMRNKMNASCQSPNSLLRFLVSTGEFRPPERLK